MKTEHDKGYQLRLLVIYFEINLLIVVTCVDGEAWLDVEDMMDVDWSHRAVETYLAGERTVQSGRSDTVTAVSVLSQQVASLVCRVALT